MRIKLEEALMLSCINGNKIQKKELAKKLFPNANDKARGVNMSNLISGRTKRIDPAIIPIIVKECGCSLEFLFGMSN